LGLVEVAVVLAIGKLAVVVGVELAIETPYLLIPYPTFYL